MLAAVAIVAVLVAVVVTYIPALVSWARQNSDKQTLTVLNDALTRYKTEGGSIAALTAGAPIAHVLSALSTPITWSGLTHSVMQSAVTYPGRSIDALGTGASYHFTRFNTYTGESGGTSPVAWVPGQMSKTGLDGYYNFNDGTDSHTTGLNMTATGTIVYSSGYVSLNTSGLSYLSRSQGALGNAGQNKSICLRARFRSFNANNNQLFSRNWRDWMRCPSGTLGAGIFDNTGLSSGTLQANTWYAVAITRNGTTGKLTLYVNGAQVASAVGTNPPSVSSGGVNIGCDADTSQPSNIDVANMSFWTRELTPTEVARLYNNGYDLDYVDL